jgi:hypothetical protein
MQSTKFLAGGFLFVFCAIFLINAVQCGNDDDANDAEWNNQSNFEIKCIQIKIKTIFEIPHHSVST